MPMGGTRRAKIVPCAICWDMPNMKIRAGTIITPAPMPINPLNMPATSPRST